FHSERGIWVVRWMSSTCSTASSSPLTTPISRPTPATPGNTSSPSAPTTTAFPSSDRRRPSRLSASQRYTTHRPPFRLPSSADTWYYHVSASHAVALCT